MEDAHALFRRWYVQPLRHLEEIPHGDGAFIALAVSCALYERYATTLIIGSGLKAVRQAKIHQFMKDFQTDERTADVFWNVIRDGLAHQAMPLQNTRQNKQPTWRFHHSYPKPVELSVVNGKDILKVQPWHFMNKVLALWEQRSELLAENASFPWGNIVGI